MDKLNTSNTDLNKGQVLPDNVQEKDIIVEHELKNDEDAIVTASSSNEQNQVMDMEPTSSLSSILHKYNIPKSYLRGKEMKKGFEALMLQTLTNNPDQPKEELVKKACRRWRDMNAMDKCKYLQADSCITKKRLLRRRI